MWYLWKTDKVNNNSESSYSPYSNTGTQWPIGLRWEPWHWHIISLFQKVSYKSLIFDSEHDDWEASTSYMLNRCSYPTFYHTNYLLFSLLFMKKISNYLFYNFRSTPLQSPMRFSTARPRPPRKLLPYDSSDSSESESAHPQKPLVDNYQIRIS